ncbi:MAG TPA: hypothetical protein VM468_12730, partial [Mycoplana sp.]|nr:hypothetical protein [Mycoplana sp.]
YAPAAEAAALAGQGVTGKVDGRAVFVGAPRHAESRAPFDGRARAAAEELESAGKTVAAIVVDGALAGLVALIRLARAAMANIHTNITIALGLKAVFLVSSVLGYTGLWVAILADTGATVIVTANALRLLRFDAGKAN